MKQSSIVADEGRSPELANAWIQVRNQDTVAGWIGCSAWTTDVERWQHTLEPALLTSVEADAKQEATPACLRRAFSITSL